MTTWYTSDWHFGHARIMEFCPQRYDYLGLHQGASLDEMNLAIVNKLNSYIHPDDTVWVLGDVAMGQRDSSMLWVNQVYGHKHLVAGNHDACHRIHTGGKKDKQGQWMRRYLNYGFETIQTSAYTDINGIAFAMSHFPYYGDHTEENRYDEYRPVDLGLPLVHGHVHDLYISLDKMYNVGIDAHDGIPVSEEQILDWLVSLN